MKGLLPVQQPNWRFKFSPTFSFSAKIQSYIKPRNYIIILPPFTLLFLGKAGYQPAPIVHSTDMTPLFTYHIHSKTNSLQTSVCSDKFSLILVQYCESPDQVVRSEHALFFWPSHLFPLPNSSLISLWGTILAPPCAVWGRGSAIDRGFCLLLSKTQTCNSSLANWLSSSGSSDKAKRTLNGSHSGGSTQTESSVVSADQTQQGPWSRRVPTHSGNYPTNKLFVCVR